MVSRSDVKSLNFTWFRSSGESFSNDIGARNDYVAAVQQGEILVIVILRQYDNGYIKLNNFFGNPLKNTFHYYWGEATTKAQLEEVLDDLDFKPLKVQVNFIS